MYKRILFWLILVAVILSPIIYGCVTSPKLKAEEDSAEKDLKSKISWQKAAEAAVAAATTPEEKAAAKADLLEASQEVQIALEKLHNVQIRIEEEKKEQTVDWIDFIQLTVLGALGAAGYRRMRNAS